MRPIIPIRETGKAPAVPACEHGTWLFAGADFKRHAAKYRCPTSECSPKSTWAKADRANPLVPRSSKRWSDL